jgi:hypothetical protein
MFPMPGQSFQLNFLIFRFLIFRSLTIAALLLGFVPRATATPTAPCCQSGAPVWAATTADPILPLTSPAAAAPHPGTTTTPSLAPDMATPETIAAAPTLPLEAAAPTPVASESEPPIFEKWWFWSAIAAFAVTAVVIVATSSGPVPPKTDLGNMPAF